MARERGYEVRSGKPASLAEGALAGRPVRGMPWLGVPGLLCNLM